MYLIVHSRIHIEFPNYCFGTLIQLCVLTAILYGIYPPANDVCQDAAFLFKDRSELIRWVYGEAWDTSSVKVWVLSSFGV